jgi:hypothetical protein
MVLAIVCGEPVLATIQQKPGFRNSVCVAPDRRSIAGMRTQVLLQTIKTKHNLPRHSMPVRNRDRRNDPSVVRHLHLHARTIANRVQDSRFPIGRRSKSLFIQFALHSIIPSEAAPQTGEI